FWIVMPFCTGRDRLPRGALPLPSKFALILADIGQLSSPILCRQIRRSEDRNRSCASGTPDKRMHGFERELCRMADRVDIQGSSGGLYLLLVRSRSESRYTGIFGRAVLFRTNHAVYPQGSYQPELEAGH